jgi:hypothetical protein
VVAGRRFLVVTRPRTHPRIFALWFALLAFSVVALLPVWTAWSLFGGEDLGYSGFSCTTTLFGALAHLPRNAELAGLSRHLLEMHAWNLRLAAGTVAGGWALGRLVYWLRWERRPPGQPDPR